MAVSTASKHAGERPDGARKRAAEIQALVLRRRLRAYARIRSLATGGQPELSASAVRQAAQ